MSGLTFGQPVQPQTTQVLTFGSSAPTATTSPFSFGTATTTTTATPTTTSSLFGGTSSFSNPFSQASTTSTGTPSLFGGFGTTAATTTTPSFFSNLGQPSITSAPSTGIGFSFGSTAPSSLAPATTTSSIGLGGVDLTTTSTPLSGLGVSRKKSDAKENPLPDEILSCLEQFKKHVKEQKVVREKISRISRAPIQKVQEEAAALSQLLAGVSNDVHRNSLAISKLKTEAAQELRNAEIAQRTKDTPPALQYENTAPLEYFQNLVISFQQQMKGYQTQIGQLEQLLLSSNPSPLTPQELTTLMRRLHETFVALAARLHGLHETVQNQREAFLSYQGRSDHETKSLTTSTSVPPSTIGPSPFTSVSSASAVAMAAAHNLGPASRTLLGGFPPVQASFGAAPGLTQPFSSSSLGLATSIADSSGQNKSFQLKPPPSSKRNKRWTSS